MSRSTSRPPGSRAPGDGGALLTAPGAGGASLAAPGSGGASLTAPAPAGASLTAPGSGGASLTAPGAGGAPAETLRLPAVDERLAPPETRLEYIDGIEHFAAPADAPHAQAHGDLAFVLRAHTAPGYHFAVDLLTRTDEASDFAPDASIFSDAVDLRTGGRLLEELAFEVSDKQALSVPTKKARELVRRGVRRVFCLVVGKKSVLEWSRETDGWRPLASGSVIEDRCLVRPLPVRALLGAAAGDGAVVEALRARKVPEFEAALADERDKGEARGEARGRAEGLRAAVEGLCEVLGIEVSARRRAELGRLEAVELEALVEAIKRTKRWPTRGGR